MLPAKVAGCRQEHSITFLHSSRGLTRGAPLSFPPARHSPQQYLRSQRLRLSPCSATSKGSSWLKRLLPGLSVKGDNAKGGKALPKSPPADVDTARQSPHADDSKPAAHDTDAVTDDQSSDKDVAVGETASDLETAHAENVSPIKEEELSLTSGVDSWDAVQEREGWGDGRDSHEPSLLNSNLGNAVFLVVIVAVGFVAYSLFGFAGAARMRRRIAAEATLRDTGPQVAMPVKSWRSKRPKYRSFDDDDAWEMEVNRRVKYSADRRMGFNSDDEEAETHSTERIESKDAPQSSAAVSDEDELSKQHSEEQQYGERTAQQRAADQEGQAVSQEGRDKEGGQQSQQASATSDGVSGRQQPPSGNMIESVNGQNQAAQQQSARGEDVSGETVSEGSDAESDKDSPSLAQGRRRGDADASVKRSATIGRLQDMANRNSGSAQPQPTDTSDQRRVSRAAARSVSGQAGVGNSRATDRVGSAAGDRSVVSAQQRNEQGRAQDRAPEPGVQSQASRRHIYKKWRLNSGNDVSDSDQDELPPLPALVAVFSDSTLPGLMEGGGKDASEMAEGWSVGALRARAAAASRSARSAAEAAQRATAYSAMASSSAAKAASAAERAGAAAGRISTAFESQSSKALQESVRSLEVAEQRAESALALAKEAEQKAGTSAAMAAAHEGVASKHASKAESAATVQRQTGEVGPLEGASQTQRAKQAVQTGFYRVANAWHQVVAVVGAWLIAAWHGLTGAIGIIDEKIASAWHSLQAVLSQITSQISAIFRRE